MLPVYVPVLQILVVKKITVGIYWAHVDEEFLNSQVANVLLLFHFTSVTIVNAHLSSLHSVEMSAENFYN